MSELFEKSLRTLELPRVLQLLSGAAVSAEAKERALRGGPGGQPEHPGAAADRGSAHCRPAGQGVLE